jgi:Tetratricopeptide repeat
MLAELETRRGTTEQAMELLREVLAGDPGNLRAAGMLARTLLDAGKATDAAKVVADLTNSRHKPAELAELVGEICMVQGRYAEAVAAFGPRVLLSPRGRRLRRRSWWRSGGPLRRPHDPDTPLDSVARGGTVALAPSPPDAAIEAITWVGWLSDHDRLADARQAIADAIAVHGRLPELLASAAGIEDTAGAVHTALFFWREAYRGASDDVDVVCGLAMSLGHMLVLPSYTYRVSDALGVLDGFVDQSHPKIRTTRVSVLLINDASAARLVAAYGPAADLPQSASRQQRNLWWRSAGPVGQLAIRVADRFRSELETLPDTGAFQRTEAESEPVARVLDSIRDMPPAAARELIRQAQQQHGRQPSLLLACAEIDDADGSYWHGLAMAAEASRSSPGSVDAISHLAWALDGAYGYGTALQALKSLPAEASETVEARVVAGDLHRYAKNFTLAATAYGDPRELDRYDRRNRRRCVLRALRERLRSASNDDVDTIDPTSFDPVSPEIARVLDQGASLIDEPATLRELAKAAIEEQGRHPLLLLGLGDAERQYGDRHACAALALEAIGRAPDDPLVVGQGIRNLWLADYDADALRASAGLSGQLRTSPLVRATTAEIFGYWHLRARALMAAGHSGLEAQQWRMRRAFWWRSGGPAGRIRSSLLARENTLLSGLALPAKQVTVLSTMRLTAPAAEAVRSDLATYQLVRAQLTVVRPEIFSDWMNRILPSASAVIIFAVIALAEDLRWPTAGSARSLTSALIITVAPVAALWAVGRIIRRWATRISVAAACGVGGVFLLRVPAQTEFGVGLALTVFAFVIVVTYLLGQIERFARRIQVARWQRRQAETGILSALLDLLGDLIVPQERRDTSIRHLWMEELERIAITIERNLPYALRSSDPDTQNAITAHMRGAATVVREMKQTVALPDDASWKDMTQGLTGLAAAMARQDFEKWPPPLPDVAAAQPPRPVWRKAMDVGRTVVVIFAPPLVAYLLPLVVPLNGPGLSWFRFATIVWALLGALIALDPAWNDRMAKMRQGLDLLRNAAPPKGTNDGQAAHSSPDVSPPQIAGLPRRDTIRSRPSRATRPRR